jgi:hypothetical protein
MYILERIILKSHTEVIKKMLLLMTACSISVSYQLELLNERGQHFASLQRHFLK